MASFAIHSLHKSFGSVKAVQDLSFEVHPGQVHGLLGPNGSGKTTTLCCALGLMRPTKGSVEVLGVSSRALHRTAGRLGVVFDQPVLLKRHFAATVSEFLSAAETILVQGNERVILCERGLRGFDSVSRNLLDVAAVAHLKLVTHLPVIVDGALAGIVSIGDLVKARMDMLEQEREQRESYIAQ